MPDAGEDTSADRGERGRPYLRVMTWNIHGCVGTDGKHDPHRVGAMIRSLTPDLAAFQEVDSRRRAGQPPLPVEIQAFLRETVGDHDHEAWALSGADGAYGQVLASRFPLHRRRVHDISVSGREPRKVMEATLRHPAGALRVLATHLGFPPARTPSPDELAKGNHRRRPVIAAHPAGRSERMAPTLPVKERPDRDNRRPKVSGDDPPDFSFPASGSAA